MTALDPIDLSHRPLPSDADLEAVLCELLAPAIRSQLWLVFLDADDRIVGPFMPNDDIRDPHERVVTDDLGEVTLAELLAHRLQLIFEAVGATQAVIVWERVGGGIATTADRRQARAHADACARVGTRLRAQFLLHSRGLRILPADDYL